MTQAGGSVLSPQRWCAWCGQTIIKKDRRRKFCKPQCLIKHQNDVARERLLARFDAGEELTDAQFSIIAARLGAPSYKVG